jgi:hypothetical protein
MQAYLLNNIREHQLNSSTVKVKLSTCLTNHHAMKKYPVLNYAPRHEDVWRVEL